MEKKGYKDNNLVMMIMTIDNIVIVLVIILRIVKIRIFIEEDWINNNNRKIVVYVEWW